MESRKEKIQDEKQVGDTSETAPKLKSKNEMEVDDIEIPDEFVDPLTGCIYQEPVITKGGLIYEKEFLINWAKAHNFETPHRVPAKGFPLFPVRDLKKNISQFLIDHPQFKTERYEPKKKYKESYVLGEMSNVAINEDTNKDNANQNVNEAAPLIPQGNNNVSNCKLIICAGGICGGVILVIGGIVALVLALSKDSPMSNLSYEFKTPYAGGGTIIIRNNNAFAVFFSSIQFSVNSVINTQKEGAIYGDLAPWGKSKIKQIASNGEWFTYEVYEPKYTNLARNSQSNFTYVFSSATGTLNVSVMPEEVKLINGRDTYPLDLYGKCSLNDCPDPMPGKSFGGYYTTWDMYQRQYGVTDIPVNTINSINYAYLKPDVNGNLILHDLNSDNIQLPMLTQLINKFPYLKISFSIGGADVPCSAFSTLAANPTARQNFANQIQGALQQFKFNGVDIDWEYPGKEDAVNFVELLKTIRRTLGDQVSITIVGPAVPYNINHIGNLWTNVTAQVNAINVKLYDYNGPWSTYSDYQSPMKLPANDPNGMTNSVDYTLGLYRQYGVPNQKIVVGIPTYYRGVLVSQMTQFGLWQRITGTPQGQFDDLGTFDYSCAIGANCYQGNKFITHCNYIDPSKAPYGNYAQTPVISCTQSLAFFTGESVDSVKNKSCLAASQNYKGVFFWALSGDVRNKNTQSLISAAYNSLKSPCTNSSASSDKSELPNNAPLQVYDESSWRLFTDQIENTVLGSFFGGVAFTFIFSAVDKLTDKLLQSFFDKTHLKDFKHKTEAYYSIKTAVYFAALYYVGLPLLPAAAGRIISSYFHYVCGISKEKASAVGMLATFFKNLQSWEKLQSPQGFVLAVVNLLVACLGSVTTDDGLKFLSAKSKANNLFGFFKETPAIDVEIGEKTNSVVSKFFL